MTKARRPASPTLRDGTKWAMQAGAPLRPACAPADEARARHIASPDRALIALATQVMFELDSELSLAAMLSRSSPRLILPDPKFAYAICHCNSVAGTPATQPQRCARLAIWALRNTIVQHEVAELKRGLARVRSEARFRMRQRAHVSTPSAELLLSCMQRKVACERRSEIITAATEQAVTLLRVASERLSSSWRTHPGAFARDRLALTLLSPVDELSTKKAKHSGLSIYNEAGDAAAA
jgi:hypothetical protein